VARLHEAGLVRVEGSRNNRQVSAEVDSVIFPDLASLLLKTVGPKPVLETGLRDVAGIESAFIYGSWARRYEGEAGSPPADIDLLVVGTPNVDAVYDVTERVSAPVRPRGEPDHPDQQRVADVQRRVPRTASTQSPCQIGSQFFALPRHRRRCEGFLMTRVVEGLLDPGRLERICP